MNRTVFGKLRVLLAFVCAAALIAGCLAGCSSGRSSLDDLLASRNTDFLGDPGDNIQINPDPTENSSNTPTPDNNNNSNNNAGNNGGDTISGNQSSQPSTPSQAKESKTVMVYIVGSDLESGNGAASEDIVEMATSGADFSKHNVVIYTGGSSKWHIPSIPTDKCAVYQVVQDDILLTGEAPLSNMADSATLADFVSYTMAEFPADQYSLILWNHGGGPFHGYGCDELSGETMSLEGICQALSAAGLGGRNKLEFIGFDACLMGSVETAWVLKDFANYMIASQEVEPGWGWDYSFLKTLSDYDSGADLGRAIIDSYFAGSNAYIDAYPQADTDLTLSCMDLSKIGQVEAGVNALFAQVDYNILNGYFRQASVFRRNVKAFGKYSSSHEYDLIDLRHMVSLLANDFPKEAGALNAALDSFITYSRSNTGNAYGVSIYHPFDNQEYMTYYLDMFDSFDFADDYCDYIATFGTILSQPAASGWRDMSSILGNATGTDTGSQLSFQLTQEQMDNFLEAGYYVLKQVGPEEYTFIYAGDDVSVSDTGLLSASYDNKAVYAINDKTNKVSKSPITMYSVNDGSGEEKYYAPAMFLAVDSNYEMRMEIVNWQLRIQNGQPELLGAYRLDESLDPTIPQKQLLDYKDFDSVMFATSACTPTYDDDGNLLPYHDWVSSNDNVYGSEQDVEKGFHLEIRDIEDAQDYYVMFVVYDTLGNEYASSLFPLNG